MPLPPPPHVSTEWLAAHLDDANLRVVDVRGKVLPAGTPGNRYFAKRDDYDARHVRGAVFVDWTSDIIDPDDPIPTQVAPPDRFAALMLALGIGDATNVVAYDDYNTVFASRFAWSLRYYGHDAVRVLDGGWALWEKEGRPSNDGVPHPAPALFTPRARPALRRMADDVARATREGALVIDARAPNQYSGEVSAAKRAGHIPGARNVHYARLIDQQTGTMLPNDELARAFAAAGIDVGALPREIICYCNGGTTATVPLMALAKLGRADVAVYDGSWNEWGNDPSRPITTGKDP
jgi:thiosulfate/3-mercaptopyruvate sulfurtransferase